MLPFNTPSSALPDKASSYDYALREHVAIMFHGDGASNGFSFDVIVRKADKSRRCFCWNFTKKEADPQCKRCSGSGFLTYDVVRRTVKKKFIGREEVQDFGEVEFDSSNFFFEHDADISQEDQIIEVVTDDKGKMVSPVKYLKTHFVRDVEPYRGEQGRVEYLRAYTNKGE